jgi:hypothetical protein
VDEESHKMSFQEKRVHFTNKGSERSTQCSLRHSVPRPSPLVASVSELNRKQCSTRKELSVEAQPTLSAIAMESVNRMVGGRFARLQESDENTDRS